MMNRKDQRSVEELLPFHANGTLDADERATVEAALQENPDLAREYEVLVALRAQMQADAPDYTPGDLGLALLTREIDRQQATANTRRYWIGAGAAAVLAAAVFLVMPLDAPQGDLFEQASGEAGDNLLVVAFRPDAAQGDIEALLSDVGLTIVDGPSALGLYRLSPLDAGLIDGAMDRLASETGLIESVDKVQ